MEYYSAIKKYGILSFATTWNLEGIILSKINQSEKEKYHMISLICRILKDNNNLTDIENKLGEARREKGARRGAIGELKGKKRQKEKRKNDCQEQEQFSKPLVIMLMQTKITRRYYYTPTRMAKTKRRHWKGYRTTQTLIKPIGTQSSTTTLENSLSVSYKVTYTYHMTNKAM